MPHVHHEFKVRSQGIQLTSEGGCTCTFALRVDEAVRHFVTAASVQSIELHSWSTAPKKENISPLQQECWQYTISPATFKKITGREVRRPANKQAASQSVSQSVRSAVSQPVSQSVSR